MSNTASSFERKPLVISGNSLWSGSMSTKFASDDPNALLRAYLTWVRDMRGQQRASSIQLRNEDVAVIASHLGLGEETVLGGLLDLMGATRTGRSTMMALLAAGALTVVLSGVTIAQQSDADMSLELGSLVDAVQSVVQRASAESGVSASSASLTRTDPAVAAAAETAATAERDAPIVVAAPAATRPVAETLPTQSDEALIESILAASETLAARRLAAADARAAAEAQSASEVSTATDEPVAVGTAADGSTVAVVAPPVAPADTEPVSTGTAADGSTVAVAAPPIAPSSSAPAATGTAPDGSTVAVAAPPVAPTGGSSGEAVATGTAPDGSTVGVAAPPVPPPSDG